MPCSASRAGTGLRAVSSSRFITLIFSSATDGNSDELPGGSPPSSSWHLQLLCPENYSLVTLLTIPNSCPLRQGTLGGLGMHPFLGQRHRTEIKW